MNISTVNEFVKQIATKEVKDTQKVEDKKNSNFKDILATKKTEINNISEKSKVSETNDKDESSKLKNVINELEDKAIKLEEAIESGEESEIVEELVDILSLLNIKVLDSTEMPLVTEITEVQASELAEILKSMDYIAQLQSTNLLENNLNVDMVNNSIDDNKTIELLVNLLSDENSINISKESLSIIKDMTGISEETGVNINKLIDMIVPLIKDSKGDNIEKNSIIKAISDKLNIVSAEDKSKINQELNSLNIAKVKLDNVMDKISDGVNNEDDSNEEDITQLSILNGKDKDVEELSEEDKILNKFLGIETTDNFAQGMNRLNSRNDLQAQNAVNPSTVFKDTMDEDILKNVKFMIKNQIQELKVKIYPKELGEMTIKILSEEGIMRAEIKATSKETYNLLNSNMNEIKKLLSNENIKIQEVNIGLYSEDTTYYSGQGFQEEFNSREQSFSTNKSDMYLNEHEEIVEEVINNDNSNVDLLV